MAKSRVLVVGATGYIGKHVAVAIARSGHPTVALVRDAAPADPAKVAIHKSLTDAGVVLIKGDLNDHESLVAAVSQADVVVSAVGITQAIDQIKIITAIKEAGNIKRFIPSEFGVDISLDEIPEPTKSILADKKKIRDTIEAEGIPYTYVISYGFTGYFLSGLGQLGTHKPPSDKVVILGDGNVKIIVSEEDDIGAYVAKAIDDPRAENKFLLITPPANIITHNELISLWEKKTGKTLERTYTPEEEILKQIAGAQFPINVMLTLSYVIFIKGAHTSFVSDPSSKVEATELYPEVKYTTIDAYLDRLL